MSGLPAGWGELELGKLFSFVIGGDWGKAPDYVDEDFVDVLCIRGTEFKNWKSNKGATASPRRIKQASLEKRSLKEGDILIEISGGGPDQPVGRTVLIDETVLKFKPEIPKVGTNFLRLARPLPVISSSYLNYYLLCFYMSGEVTKYQGGSNNLRNLKFKNYITINVPIAPLNEQIRIANKLDSLLGKLQATQKRLDKIPTLLKRYRQSVLAAAVSGELTKEWREKQSSKLELYKYKNLTSYNDSDLKKLPSQWGWAEFNEVAEIKSNLVDPKLTPNDIHLAPNHIEPDTGRIIATKTVEQDGVKSAKHRFHKGQIVYSKIRPYLNKVVLVDFGGLCSADMYPINALINSQYLSLYFLSSQFVHWTSLKQSRVVLPKINQKGLSSIPVPVPPKEEQKQIVKRVEALFKLADQAEQHYQAAKQRTDKLTQSILAKAFRGELVPQDPNDEPASELLKRIQAEKNK